MSDLPTPKPVSESRVVTTEIVLPSHTNQLGTIFGGQLMAWIDVTAAIAASRHARSVCVTASIDALHFVAPVRLGHHVTLRASVNYTGLTSMEVGVRLDSEDPVTGERTHVATSYLTFVAIDESRKPRRVAPVLPESPDEKRRFEHAKARRAARLALKKQLAPLSKKPPPVS
jgi:acyl-CoA hydrolase